MTESSETNQHLTKFALLMDGSDLQYIAGLISVHFPHIPMIISTRSNNRVTISTKVTPEEAEEIQRLADKFFKITLKTSTEEVPIMIVGLH